MFLREKPDSVHTVAVMARPAQAIAIGVPHHITQRGWPAGLSYRCGTFTGRPVGSDEFAERLEQTHRKLRPHQGARLLKAAG